ncbi:MAG: hypothetical protein O2931_12985 [Planctomycetota bacterium]|nr:hypothetical protein [Planctomycetota bacterium]MDA1179698.1 hypothetical protein [Planctomycetota bacterium]
MPDNSLHHGRKPDAISHRSLLSLPDVSPASMVARQKAAFAEMLEARSQASLRDELGTPSSRATLEKQKSVQMVRILPTDGHLSEETETHNTVGVAAPACDERVETVGEAISGNSAANHSSTSADAEVTISPAIRFGTLPTRLKRTGVIAVTLLALWFVVVSMRKANVEVPENSVADANTPARKSVGAPPSSAPATTEQPIAPVAQSDATKAATATEVHPALPSMEPPPTLEVTESSPVATSPVVTSNPAAANSFVPALPPTAVTASNPTDGGMSLGQSGSVPTTTSYPETAYPALPVAPPAQAALPDPRQSAVSSGSPVTAAALSSTGYPQTSPDTYLYPAEMPYLQLNPQQPHGAGSASLYPQTNAQPSNSVPATQLQGQIGRVPTGTIR